MENFSRGGDRGGRNGGSRGSFRNGGFRGGAKGGFKGGWKGGDSENFKGNDRSKSMYPAICSSCGKSCEVPFRPTGEKPVYCRDCFAGRAALGGERSNRRDERIDSRSQSNNVPFNSNNSNNSNSKPHPSSNNNELKKQIDSMNVKLDKLTNTIQNLAEKINKAEAITIVPATTPTKVVVKETTAPTVKVASSIKEKMIAKPKIKAVSKKTIKPNKKIKNVSKKK